MLSSSTSSVPLLASLVLLFAFFSASVVALETQADGRLGATGRSRATRHDMSRFYHTSAQIIDEFHKIKNTPGGLCGSMDISSRKNGNAELDVITLTTTQNPKHRVLLFFGEHGRELISPESAIRFTQYLCGAHAQLRPQAQAILRDTNFIILPNINKWARTQIETTGNYCQRSNQNRVDLNRNWAYHWQDESKDPRAYLMAIKNQSWGGRRAFSEPETQLLKSLSDAFSPTIFLTVHSGTLGMYMPYAYNGKYPKNVVDANSMRNIIDKLNQRYCACSAGPAGKEVGYLCPGTCLDYMYDKIGTKHAYGYEIWDGETAPGYSHATSTASLLETASTTATTGRARARSHPMHVDDHGFDHRLQQHVSYSDAQAEMAGEMMVSGDGHDHSGGDEHHEEDHHEAEHAPSPGMFPQPINGNHHACLKMFNPTTVEDYHATLDNWARAFLDTIQSSQRDKHL